MSNTKFSVGIRDNGKLVRSFIVNMDWDDIDAHVAKLEAEHAPLQVEVVEMDYDGAVDDREYHEAQEQT